jgi:hypothetical protein
VYEEKDIQMVLSQSDDLLTGSDDALTSAEQEIYTYIDRQKKAHKTTTLSNLLDYFQARPYGWYPNAILTLIASMFMKQKLDLKQNSTPLSKQEVYTALTNNRQFNTLVVPKAIIDDKKVKETKKILSLFYPNASFTSSSTREIYDVAMDETKKLIGTCKNYMHLSYPFKEAFSTIIETLSPIEKLTTDTLFDEIPSMEDTLLDTKEDFIDPIMEFMNGEKRKIYDSIIKYLHDNQNNLRHITDLHVSVLEALPSLPKPYTGNHIAQAKLALTTVEGLLKPLIEQSQQEAIAKIDHLIHELQQSENFSKVPESERYKIIKPREELKQIILRTNSIDTIKQRSNQEALVDELNKANEVMFDLIPEEIGSTPKPMTVRMASITPKNKMTLKNDEDVNEYIEKLKANLLKEIHEGKQVVL